MAGNGALLLGRLFLHNWHRFEHHLLEIEDSLYLTGHNGAGKSSILDALQFVLIADRQRVRFNTSALEEGRNLRTLETYVRGKIGEDRWLRPGDTVAYLALGFAEKGGANPITAGACIEVGSDGHEQVEFFIVPAKLDPALFEDGAGRELTRRELKPVIKAAGGRTYPSPREYAADLRTRLGGLNERFSDLFLRALAFQPIRNVRGFVERFVLAESKLQLDTLQAVRDRLDGLERDVAKVRAQTEDLRAIGRLQHEVARLGALHAKFVVLSAILAHRKAVADRDEQEARREAHQAQLEQTAEHLESTAAFLDRAQRAERDAELRYRENDTVKRHEELGKDIRRLEAEVGVILGRQKKLAAELLAQADRLRTSSRIVQDPALEALAGRIGSLAHVFDRGIVEAVAGAIPALERGQEAAIERRGELDRVIRELTGQAREIEAELAELRRGHVSNPPAVERMRSLLEQEVGVRPRLLCELLEIPDPRWQDAVEALLGRRRFSLVVPPGQFEAALAVLDHGRQRYSLYDVALLDLEKAHESGRPALSGSLATKVKASDPPVQAYVDVVLGHVITCDDVHELRKHARAVTADVVRYEEFSVRAVDPRTFRPWRIGERAVASQIESRQRDLAALGERIASLAGEHERAKADCEALSVVRALAGARALLDEALDEAPIRDHIRELRFEQESLDLSGVQALKEAWDRLAGEANRLAAEHAALLQAKGRLEREVAAFASGVLAKEREMAECAARRDDACRTFRQGVEAAEADAVGLGSGDLVRGLQVAQTKATEFQTKLGNTRVELGGLCSGFNVKYQFAGSAHDPAAPEYADRLGFLEESRLPEFEADISKAKAEADDELREHIVHKLREQIGSAKEQLRRINDALAKIPPFRDERYHFVSQPADDLAEFYRLVMETSVAPRGTLFAEGLSDADKAVFDRFYTALTRTPATDAERREQDRLTDYRSYLDYDLEVRHASGQKSRLSRILGQNSGGENQTPFYVTIAASFVQLFKIGERTRKPCIRLVVFDEAFSKMDQDRIAATLDLFNQFQLQVVTATPLERCEYLVPRMCTSLVLTNLGDTVLVEPYRNYKARIALEDGEAEADADAQADVADEACSDAEAKVDADPEPERGNAVPV